MKKVLVLGVLAALGVWYVSSQQSLAHYLPQRAVVVDTFETAFSGDDIMARHAKELLLSPQHTFGSTTLLSSPHLLIHVKYCPSSTKTQSAAMLWNLVEGELVLSTDSFEHTQGFSDCLTSKANAEDFRILRCLTQKGLLSKEMLAQELGMEDQALCRAVDRLRTRHLVTISHDNVRLHIETPLLKVDPVTTMTRPLVQRTTPQHDIITATFSQRNIEQLIVAAFGNDIAIRSIQRVYVPIYEIQIRNPDGSLRKTWWNAMSGKEVYKQGLPL